MTIGLLYSYDLLDMSIPERIIEVGSSPCGFLLFDRQVQYHKAWLAFRQTPEVQALKEQTTVLKKQLTALPEQRTPRNEEFLPQLTQLRATLDQARASAKQAKIEYEDQRSLRAKLYRVARVIAPSLAEYVIPYETTQLEVIRTRDQRKAREAEFKTVRRVLEQEEASLKRQLTSVEASIQETQNRWLFSSPERALLYALTNLAHDSAARNRFLIQFAQSSGVAIPDVQRQYIELAAKAAPSLYTESVIEVQKPFVQAVRIQEDPKPAYNYRERYDNSFGETAGLPEDNSGRKKIILKVDATPIALDELSERQLDKIISDSRTPLSRDQIKQIIEALSSSDHPLAEYQRHPQTVKMGEFKGFHVLKRGRQGRVLFKYINGEVHIRFGDYYKVYADGKKWDG